MGELFNKINNDFFYLYKDNYDIEEQGCSSVCTSASDHFSWFLKNCGIKTFDQYTKVLDWKTKAFILYCCTLTSWLHKIVICSRTDSLQLEDNNESKCIYENFPHTTYKSYVWKNCQNYILM